MALGDLSPWRQGEWVSEKSSFLWKIMDNLSCFAGLLSRDGVLLEANSAALKAAGVARADVIGKQFEETVWWNFSQQSKDRLRDSIRQGALGKESRYDVEVRLAQGKMATVDFRLSPLYNEMGEVEFLLPSAIDVTERLQAQSAASRAELFYRRIFESNIVAVAISSIDGQVLEANDSYLDLVQCSREDLKNGNVRWDKLTAKECASIDKLRVLEMGRQGACRPYEKEYVLASGKRVPILISYAQLYEGEGTHIALVHDLTRLKSVEARLRKRETQLLKTQDYLEKIVQKRTKNLQEALSQKEALIKEVHHRVKNNLNLIVSLLELQASQLDPSAAAPFEDARNRILSISLIHEKLYKSSDLASIDLEAYIRDLTGHILHAVGRRPDISVGVHAPGVKVGVTTAVPLSLIINELLTNAVKHAFGNGPGKVSIALRSLGDQEIELTFSDNGVGMPPEKLECETLGIRLIKTLVKQLNGEMSVASHNGTTFRVKLRSR